MITYLSWDSLHHISRGDIESSPRGILDILIFAPIFDSWTISGTALHKPPAPISWILLIGVRSFRYTHWLITSWHRRSISGLSLWTEEKSKSSVLEPDDNDEAAPPPIPITYDGPPRIMTKSPSDSLDLCVWLDLMVPMPPASIIGLWYPIALMFLFLLETVNSQVLKYPKIFGLPNSLL